MQRRERKEKRLPQGRQGSNNDKGEKGQRNAIKTPVSTHTHTLLKKSLKKSKFSSETYQHWVSSNNGQVPRMVFGFLLCVFWLIDWLPGGWKKIKEMVTTGGEG